MPHVREETPTITKAVSNRVFPRTVNKKGATVPSTAKRKIAGPILFIFAAATIKPAIVHVKCHPYLPERELLDYCRTNGIVLQAFAALRHSSQPNLLEDPAITAIAQRVGKTPAQGCARVGYPTRVSAPDHVKKTRPYQRQF